MGDVVTVTEPTAVPVGDWPVGAVTGLMALVAAGVSFAAVLTGKRNALARLYTLSTIVHEAGHASVSILTGGGVYRFQITGAESGVTYTWWPTKLSSIAVSAAGYAMPPLAGLGAAVLLHRGHVTAVLTLTVVAMALLLLIARDVRTFGIVTLMAGVAFVVASWGSGWLQAWIGYAEAWVLLTGEIASVAGLVTRRLHGWSGSDDADHLADKTHIPAFVWIAGWFALLGWALWHGVPLLL